MGGPRGAEPPWLVAGRVLSINRIVAGVNVDALIGGSADPEAEAAAEKLAAGVAVARWLTEAIPRAAFALLLAADMRLAGRKLALVVVSVVFSLTVATICAAKAAKVV